MNSMESQRALPPLTLDKLPPEILEEIIARIPLTDWVWFHLQLRLVCSLFRDLIPHDKSSILLAKAAGHSFPITKAISCVHGALDLKGAKHLAAYDKTIIQLDVRMRYNMNAKDLKAERAKGAGLFLKGVILWEKFDYIVRMNSIPYDDRLECFFTSHSPGAQLLYRYVCVRLGCVTVDTVDWQDNSTALPVFDASRKVDVVSASKLGRVFSYRRPHILDMRDYFRPVVNLLPVKIAVDYINRIDTYSYYLQDKPWMSGVSVRSFLCDAGDDPRYIDGLLPRHQRVTQACIGLLLDAEGLTEDDDTVRWFGNHRTISRKSDSWQSISTILDELDCPSKTVSQDDMRRILVLCRIDVVLDAELLNPRSNLRQRMVGGKPTFGHMVADLDDLDKRLKADKEDVEETLATESRHGINSGFG